MILTATFLSQLAMFVGVPQALLGLGIVHLGGWSTLVALALVLLPVAPMVLKTLTKTWNTRISAGALSLVSLAVSGIIYWEIFRAWRVYPEFFALD